MSSLILCHKQKAIQPYEIERVHRKIYTLEELCYYICNHVHLLDHTLMNFRLCKWVEMELGMKSLAKQLRACLSEGGGLVEFMMTILQSTHIYAPAELNRIQSALEMIFSQKEEERMKNKGDRFWEMGEYEGAILVYQSILTKLPEEDRKSKFYGGVCASLGAAYGRLFLYTESMKYYEEAFRVLREDEVAKSYLYACFKALESGEYVKMLSGNSLFLRLDAQLKEEFREIVAEREPICTPEELVLWKKKYKGLTIHEPCDSIAL